MRQGQVLSLDVEGQILGFLGQHNRIIAFYGKHGDDLLLEHMPNSSVAEYLYNADSQPVIEERLKGTLQTVEAVVYILDHQEW